MIGYNITNDEKNTLEMLFFRHFEGIFCCQKSIIPKMAQKTAEKHNKWVYFEKKLLKYPRGQFGRRISNPPLQVCRALSGGKGDAYVSGS